MYKNITRISILNLKYLNQVCGSRNTHEFQIAITKLFAIQNN